MITESRVAPDVVALSASIPGPDGMMLPVNAYCLLGSEPVLVDTGLSPLGEEFRTALWRLVDPDDLHWIVVTHDDRDHTGSLRTILDQAPQATVVTNFISMVKIGEDWPLPMDRLRLVNSGDRLEIGDDVLDMFRPPTYDSPGTLAFHALRRGICFSSDCLGAFLPGTVDLAATADDVPAADYAEGVAVFASALSPWMHDIAADRWHSALGDLRRRNVRTLLSTHGLPVGRGLEPLLDMAAGLPTGAAFVPPAQEFVEAMLAMSGAEH
jgi:flavorubredoxin